MSLFNLYRYIRYIATYINMNSTNGVHVHDLIMYIIHMVKHYVSYIHTSSDPGSAEGLC